MRYNPKVSHLGPFTFRRGLLRLFSLGSLPLNLNHGFQVTKVTTLQALLVPSVHVFVAQHHIAVTPWAAIQQIDSHVTSYARCMVRIYR